MKRKHRTQSRVENAPGAVEILTIGWMLMVVTTLACEIGFVLARGLAAEGDSLMALSAVLLFAAVVIGILALLLTPIVMRRRRTAPPRGILVFAAIISAMPLVVLLLEGLRR
ncbi:MAG TPA: hypothetical protein VF278_13055 [Pirellulales bacterium]